MEPHQTPPQTEWDAFVAARTRAIRSLLGTVLEIGAGRGENFSSLASDVTWLGLEPSTRFRRILTETARRAGHSQPPLVATAERIPVRDAGVDGVFATTVMCSVSDPDQVLKEILRVLVPGGRVVLAEHVAAPSGSKARTAQRLVRPWTKLFDHGCDPTRDTEAAVQRSDLDVQEIRRFVVPVIGRLRMPFVVISARKPSGS
ncbi:MAG: class I SAM-dependent methyltransferase [Micrococcaceae bacterium]|nr:class I SAM-dependent methyltransferase [Micrococcaceae bacterium]